MVDPSAVAGLSQFPAPMTLALEANVPMGEAIAAGGARLVDVATTLAITVDDATASRVARSTHCQVEHLELFGVATACVARGIPFAGVLAVANFVGAGARDEWRAHHHAAEAMAADRVIRWLESGASGP
jgi:nucleoside phosphorylase